MIKIEVTTEEGNDDKGDAIGALVFNEALLWSCVGRDDAAHF